MKEMLLETIVRAKQKYSFRVENFCVMGNHLHLILRPLGLSSLSRIMQWILSVFATRFNRVHQLRGHVWYDRFRSKVIDSIRQYLATFDYVNENPVRAGMVGAAIAYPYCGLRHIRDGSYIVVDPPDAVTRLLRPGFSVPALA